MPRRDIGYIHPLLHTVGVDPGQSRDPTAIAIVETEKLVRCWRDERDRIGQEVEAVEHRVRHLERLPLGSPYPLQVAHVRGLMASALLRDPELVIDETGVGRPVCDLFEQDGLRPERVTITAGLEEGRGSGPRSWHVPKIVLVSRLQAALHAGDLKLALALVEAETLKRELGEFRMRHTATGAAVFGAREGRHDDLVFAGAIGLWRAVRRVRGVDVIRSAPLLGL
jgi:hypothetical protein